jgi:DNA-binding Lrp family transcriptional regulator
MLSGRHDFLAEFIVASSRRLAEILTEDVARIAGIVATTTESVLREFKATREWGQAVLMDVLGGAGPTPAMRGPALPVELDDMDLQIVRVLRENGRLRFAEVGERVGLSQWAVRRRVEALIATGALKPVTLVDVPEIRTPILLSWLCAFINSFDQLESTIFLVRPGSTALPIAIYDYTLKYQDPTVAALSSLIIAFSLALVALATALLRRGGGMRALRGLEAGGVR